MDTRCKNCPQVCKMLDPDDQPEHYIFYKLTPTEVVDAFEESIKGCLPNPNLEVKQSAHSEGAQVAILLDSPAVHPTSNSFDRCIVLVAQAKLNAEQLTDLWIRYGTPDRCCEKFEVVSAITNLVCTVLGELHKLDHVEV